MIRDPKELLRAMVRGTEAAGLDDAARERIIRGAISEARQNGWRLAYAGNGEAEARAANLTEKQVAAMLWMPADTLHMSKRLCSPGAPTDSVMRTLEKKKLVEQPTHYVAHFRLTPMGAAVREVLDATRRKEAA